MYLMNPRNAIMHFFLYWAISLDNQVRKIEILKVDRSNQSDRLTENKYPWVLGFVSETQPTILIRHLRLS